MNRLSSKQRKVVYFLGIIVLLIPIIMLGMPGSGSGDTGGKLAQLRRAHGLGESELGSIDPTSAAMNLVLLGFRGIAADLIWVEANDNQETKNWAQLRANVDSIIMLQPHFVKVWQFQGWNLSYNVSAAWDLVADRFYWVKEGAKFLKRGADVNKKVAQIPYDEGRITGTKIGRADESLFYRKFFKEKDPNEELFKGRPDPELNPEGKDNYQVAKTVYEKANDLEEKYGQIAMLRPLFRQYPYRSQLSYAEALNQEGIFDEYSQIAWEQGAREWVDKYGQEEYLSPEGKYRLGMSSREIEEQARLQNTDLEDYRRTVVGMQNTARYNYWKTRAQVESAQLMVDAHKAIYDGRQTFRKGNLSAAKDGLLRGMTLYQQLVEKYPVLTEDDESIEEALTAVLYWQYILKLQFQPIPEKFPLSELWGKSQRFVPDIEERFKRENALK